MNGTESTLLTCKDLEDVPGDAARFVSERAGTGTKRLLSWAPSARRRKPSSEEAERCGMFYVNHRWARRHADQLGDAAEIGIKRLKLLKCDGTEDRSHASALPKKEAARLDREMKHLVQNFAGVENMSTLPDVMFVIDPNSEVIAVREAASHGRDRRGDRRYQLRSGTGGLGDSGK